MIYNALEELLHELNVEFEPLDLKSRDQVLQSWLTTFANEVKKQTGQWIHERFRWHCFSYGFRKAVEGDSALQAYSEQWMAKFVIFDETGNWCATCQSENYPDLSSLGQDLYVAHHNMKWTMVFTHEQPHIGPFFCMSK